MQHPCARQRWCPSEPVVVLRPFRQEPLAYGRVPDLSKTTRFVLNAFIVMFNEDSTGVADGPVTECHHLCSFSNQ